MGGGGGGGSGRGVVVEVVVHHTLTWGPLIKSGRVGVWVELHFESIVSYY